MFVELKQEYLGQPAGARLDVEDAAGQALIDRGIANAVAGDAIGPIVSRSMDAAVANLQNSIQRTIETTLKDFAHAQTRSRKNAVPAIFGPGASGDAKRTFGSFLLALRQGDASTLDALGSRWADWENVGRKAALNTQTGTQGGYTVPTEFLAELLAISSENSIVESRATRIPMSSNSVEIPALDVTTAPSAGDTAFFGGLTANWTEEAVALTEEEPIFRQIRLQAHELSGYTLASNALLADNAIGLEALLLELFGRALAWYKDYAFLRGNGAGKPLGVLNATALLSVTRSAASAFALADAATMLSRLLPGWTPSSTVWAMHPTVLAKLIQMAGNSGTSSNVVYIDNARDKPAMILFGIPIVVTEKLPSLNTLGDVLLLDLRHYLIGDRQMVEIAFSEHYRFINNQGTWRFVARCDGQPWLRDKVTLADASSTLSPFVGLAAG